MEDVLREFRRAEDACFDVALDVQGRHAPRRVSVWFTREGNALFATLEHGHATAWFQDVQANPEVIPAGNSAFSVRATPVIDCGVAAPALLK